MAWLLTENINMFKFINCHIAKCQVFHVYLAYLRYFDDTVTIFGEMLSINMPNSNHSSHTFYKTLNTGRSLKQQYL